VTSAVYGLGRNTLLYLIPEGFLGIKIRSSVVLLLAFLLPMPFLAGIYYVIEAGALAVYFTLWVAASTGSLAVLINIEIGRAHV